MSIVLILLSVVVVHNCRQLIKKGIQPKANTVSMMFCLGSLASYFLDETAFSLMTTGWLVTEGFLIASRVYWASLSDKDKAAWVARHRAPVQPQVGTES